MRLSAEKVKESFTVAFTCSKALAKEIRETLGSDFCTPLLDLVDMSNLVLDNVMKNSSIYPNQS